MQTPTRLMRVVIGLALSAVMLPAFGQNFYNKSGTTVSISPGGTISVKDTLINEGTLINNGNMAVGSAWLNLGTYNPGEGQITFNGTNPSVPQVINHNNQSFSKLVISGGGLKQILADLTVEESLTLTDGIITAANGAKVHFTPGAVITGGSDEAHINAPVYQQGAGIKRFPVGNGTTYLPVEIEGMTAGAEVGITLTELTSGQSLNKSSSLSDISDKRYWAVDATGSLTGTVITLPVEGDEGLDALKSNEFVVAFSESISGNFTSLGRSQISTSALVQSEQPLSEGFVTVGLLSENQSIVVFNAISPTAVDGLNDYTRIENLAEGDIVSIYNRWGDLVFEMKNYDNENAAKRFNGQSNVNGSKDLPTGNYFYVIRRKAGKEVSGYLSLRR